MCVVCGCNKPEVTDADRAPVVNPTSGDLHFGVGEARVSVPGMSTERVIKLEADVLGANKLIAEQNREHFAAHGVTAYNLVSSPGSGKTTLLCATIDALKKMTPAIPLAVIEGDQQTSNDADRIRATGAAAIQINTGKGCHLDAPMVAAAFSRLDLHAAQHTHGHDHDQGDDQSHGHEHAHGHDHEHDHAHGHHHDHGHEHRHEHRHEHGHDHDHDHDHSPRATGQHGNRALLFIENVGNLVCPAMWDLGEAAKVVILSVTEGEDKPLKYPDMFAAARLMVLNKADLLPYLHFDVVKCIDNARRVNPGIEILLVSAQTGQGMDAWVDWVLADRV